MLEGIGAAVPLYPMLRPPLLNRRVQRRLPPPAAASLARRRFCSKMEAVVLLPGAIPRRNHNQRTAPTETIHSPRLLLFLGIYVLFTNMYRHHKDLQRSGRVDTIQLCKPKDLSRHALVYHDLTITTHIRWVFP